MKRFWVLMLAMAVCLAGAWGAAHAEQSRIPQTFQEQYEQLTGSTAKLVNAIWFPIVPEYSPYKWDNVLIISNFNNFEIQVTCWFTTSTQTQTIKLYTLDFYEKLILFLDQVGFGDELYDIYCASNDLFGAAALLLENGQIVTAWPPIY